MFIEIRNCCLLLFSYVIIQTNFSYSDLLNFTKKCIGGQIKVFSFLFCTAGDVKSTKDGDC